MVSGKGCSYKPRHSFLFVTTQMHLQIQASSARAERLPLYGKTIYVSVNLVESIRVGGKPRKRYIGRLAYFKVPSTVAAVEVGEAFWRDVRARMEELGVPADERKDFIARIEELLAAIAAANGDPDLRRRLQDSPTKVLSELRKKMNPNGNH